ncbi:hypothetical protein RIF29_24386 [Crotalaria pallida]|uniref:Uncharacterized protein n=1 Tax=Crotalaria pallida TaxID=3830 RepID=A0AAN9EKH5_CROPI
MAKKKTTHQSKQQQHVPQPPQEPQSQPPLPIDNATPSNNNNKLQSLKSLNSLLLKETSQRRQQVESLESLLSQTADDNVVSELEKSVAYAFVKSQVAEMGFRFVTERNDTVLELEEKVLEAENRERKVLEELREAKSVGEKLVEEATAERDWAVRNSEELREKVLEGENRERKVLEELRKAKSEVFEKERVIGEAVVERESAAMVIEELKERVLEGEDRERKVLKELRKVKSEGEGLREEGFLKERVIGEVKAERDSVLRNLRESEILIEKLKGEMDLVMREKDEISKANNVQKMKINSMESDSLHMVKALNDMCKEAELMSGKIRELEEKVGMAAEKEEGLMSEIRDLLKQKEEMEESVEMLKEGKDSIEKVLEGVRKELEDKQREIEEVKVSYGDEIMNARYIANDLKQACQGYERKNAELLLEVGSYRDSVKGVMVEKDNIMKRFDEEKTKVERLMLQVAEMEGRIEEMADKIGMMRSEKKELLEKNEMVQSRVSVLMNEKVALQQSLLNAQRECDDMKAKVEFSCANSDRVLEMLKSTAATVCQQKEGAEEVVSTEEKPEGEILLCAEQLNAIRDAFRSQNKKVADMKQQFESLQKSVTEAHKMKSLWTMISSGTSVLAAAFAAAYVTKGH